MIPFVDLKAQYLSLKEEIDAVVAMVFKSCQFILGDEVAAFEKEFAAYAGARFGVAVNSGGYVGSETGYQRSLMENQCRIVPI